MTDRAKTFVLVHGAWHGGWCWRRVADRLAARGHRVFANSLTGLADRAHLAGPSVTLTTHAEDVAGLIRAEELTDVVLVGHSYGGMVISQAVEKIPAGTVSSLVFLDAFLPEDGKSLFDYTAVEGREGGPMVEEGERTGLVSPIPAAFFGVNAADRAWVDAQCTPQPVGAFTEKVRLTGAREAIPRKTYIYATGWAPAFAEFAVRVKGDPAWRYLETNVGHDVMLDAPDWLAAALEDA
jgi:pimeloyl-ACP methyl ester carboxylesterase